LGSGVRILSSYREKGGDSHLPERKEERKKESKEAYRRRKEGRVLQSVLLLATSKKRREFLPKKRRKKKEGKKESSRSPLVLIPFIRERQKDAAYAFPLHEEKSTPTPIVVSEEGGREGEKGKKEMGCSESKVRGSRRSLDFPRSWEKRIYFREAALRGERKRGGARGHRGGEKGNSNWTCYFSITKRKKKSICT